MTEPSTPLVCRLGLHRWSHDKVGSRRCLRAGCTAVEVVTADLEVAVEGALPAGDYWVTVTRHDGKIIYEGPCPVPDGIDTVSVADLRAGRFNKYEFFPVELDDATTEG